MVNVSTVSVSEEFMDVLAERRRRDAERKRRKRAEKRAQEAQKLSEAAEVCPQPEEAVDAISVANDGDTDDHCGDVGAVLADNVVEESISAFELLRRRRDKERR